jgi:mono/diheme cytochrome c family protein
MSLFRNLRDISHLSLRLSTLAVLVGLMAGFSNVLEAIELKSEREQQAGSSTKKVTGDKVGSARNGTGSRNPRAGKELFEKHCVTCHGPRGRGDGLEIAGATVADLSSPATQRKLNVDLLATIHEGQSGKVMPSWKYRLSKEQSIDVLAYVRTLRRK